MGWCLHPESPGFRRGLLVDGGEAVEGCITSSEKPGAEAMGLEVLGD